MCGIADGCKRGIGRTEMQIEERKDERGREGFGQRATASWLRKSDDSSSSVPR